MTLLESLVALVILGASAAGFLGVFQSAARTTRSAEEWNRATATAQAMLEDAVRARIQGDAVTMPDDRDTHVRVAPWTPGVDDIVVQVRLPDGRMFTVHQLVRHK